MENEFKGFDNCLEGVIITEGNPVKIVNEYYVSYVITDPVVINERGRRLFSRVPDTLEIAIHVSSEKNYTKFEKDIMNRFYEDYIKGDDRGKKYLRYAEKNIIGESAARVYENEYIEIFSVIWIPYCKDTDHTRITKLEARSRDERWNEIIK